MTLPQQNSKVFFGAGYVFSFLGKQAFLALDGSRRSQRDFFDIEIIYREYVAYFFAIDKGPHPVGSAQRLEECIKVIV